MAYKIKSMHVAVNVKNMKMIKLEFRISITVTDFDFHMALLGMPPHHHNYDGEAFLSHFCPVMFNGK